MQGRQPDPRTGTPPSGHPGEHAGPDHQGTHGVHLGGGGLGQEPTPPLATPDSWPSSYWRPCHHTPRRCRARLPYRDAPHYNGWRPFCVKPLSGNRPLERARTRPCWAPSCGNTGNSPPSCGRPVPHMIPCSRPGTPPLGARRCATRWVEDAARSRRRSPTWPESGETTPPPGCPGAPHQGEHSHALLAELVEEARLGRVHGPCKALPGWPRRCVAAANFQTAWLTHFGRHLSSPSSRKTRQARSNFGGGKTGADPITTPQCRPPTSPLTTWWATMWTCRLDWPNKAKRSGFGAMTS